MTIRSQLHEMCTGKKKPVQKKVLKESCVQVPERSVIWHEGVRYQFRNGMWATPRGYVWPNTELCHELDAAHEAHQASGKSYWEEDQQGVGIPQTVAGAKQFAGNVEDRKVNLKIQTPAKEGTPNTGATSPNESKVEERGLKPFAAAPFSSWGKVGYERRLLTLFTGATYTNESEAGESENQESPELEEAFWGKVGYFEKAGWTRAEVEKLHAKHLGQADAAEGAADEHSGKATYHDKGSATAKFHERKAKVLRKIAANHTAKAAELSQHIQHWDPLKESEEVNEARSHGPGSGHAFTAGVQHGFAAKCAKTGHKEAAEDARTIGDRCAVKWAEASRSDVGDIREHPRYKDGYAAGFQNESIEVDEAKRGRPRSMIGVRTYQGQGAPRKRIRGADGQWRWASKNRV